MFVVLCLTNWYSSFWWQINTDCLFIFYLYTHPRLLGQNCNFYTTLLSRNSQKRLEHKENQTWGETGSVTTWGCTALRIWNASAVNRPSVFSGVAWVAVKLPCRVAVVSAFVVAKAMVALVCVSCDSGCCAVCGWACVACWGVCCCWCACGGAPCWGCCCGWVVACCICWTGWIWWTTWKQVEVIPLECLMIRRILSTFTNCRSWPCSKQKVSGTNA